MKRLLLYVHFNKDDELADHVIYQLQRMNPLFSRVIFITNSKLTPVDKRKLKSLYDVFIERPNHGFDFGAWSDGIKKIGWKELEKYDSVTLMNDTCFGPIYPIEPVYEKMESRRLDFWGATIHNGGNKGMPGTDGPVPEHIQSYFMVFSKKVIASKEFQRFWNGVKSFTDVDLVIQNYETQLTHVLSKKFVYGSIVRHSDKLPDITYVKPRALIKMRFPFVKVKAFLGANDTLTPSGLIRYVARYSEMPASLMRKHINSLYNRRRRIRSVVRRIRHHAKAVARTLIGRGV